MELDVKVAADLVQSFYFVLLLYWRILQDSNFWLI